MVVKNFGEDKWKNALVKAKIDKEPRILATSDIDDQIVLKIVNSVREVLNISLVQAADAFGDYWVNVYSQKMYRPYFIGVKTAKEFLLKMDSVHAKTTRNMPNAYPPRFEYKWEGEKTLIMKYKSQRGLIDFMVGMIKGVGKHYNEELKVTKLGGDKVRVIFP
ncbi:MAG: heme NO-binding domain-containing protein [Thermotogae bacterium]|nr:heme NO-binding domain-containing protein [Thermotogota bacterium]